MLKFFQDRNPHDLAKEINDWFTKNPDCIMESPNYQPLVYNDEIMYTAMVSYKKI